MDDPWSDPSDDPWQDNREGTPDPWDSRPDKRKEIASDSKLPCSKQRRVTEVHLSRSHLQLAAGSKTKQKWTQYEKAGSSPAAIQQRWAKPCPRAGCLQPACKRQGLDLQELTALCRDFWALTSEQRTHLMQVTYGEGDARRPEHRAVYYIGQSRVCFENFCAKLGTSPMTMRRHIAGCPDLRQSRSPATQDKKAQAKCDHFFQELHQSVAEAMPEDEACGGDPWEEITYDWSCSPPLTVSCLARVAGLPVRYIQHCKLSDLYWQMQAEWGVLSKQGADLGKVPSYDTFIRRYKSHWKQVLRMRKTSQHSQCKVCFDLQLILHSPAVPLSAKMNAAARLRQHQEEQYTDRCLYWSLRFASKSYANVLVIIIDDMDHSKFAWPRWGFTKVTHELDNVIRPTVTFTGALAHGWCTSLYMASQQVAGGADYFLEVLCQTIQSCYELHLQSLQSHSPAVADRPWPEHLVVVADNTVKSAKNQTVLKFLAHLVCRGLFRSTVLFSLMVGHTHEDIDQLFALVTSMLRRKGRWQTPAEVLAYITTELEVKKGAQAQSCSPAVFSRQLSGIRNFTGWMEPMGVARAQVQF